MKRMMSGIWNGVHALIAKVSSGVICVENETVEEVPIPEENQSVEEVPFPEETQIPTLIPDKNSNPEGVIADGEKPGDNIVNGENPEDNSEDVEILDTEKPIANEQVNSIDETCLSIVHYPAPPLNNTTQAPIRKQGKKRKWEPSLIESPSKRTKM